MEFKKKLKQRLYVAISYIALGIILIAGSFIAETEDSWFSSFGFIMVIMGLVRIRNHRIITKNEETVRKQEIAETDERTVSIIYKARSAAFLTFIIIACVAVIVLSSISMHEVARWIGMSVFALIVIYWIFYWIYQKKL